MKRVLITSAIPSVNGVKHLGNLVGSMLPADVFARYCRARGYETLAICATDEHGAPIELAAAEDGIPVAEYCDKWHAVQADLGARFGLSWDHFGRSSSDQNRDLTWHFARQLWKNGHLEVRTSKQAYSATDGRFLPDRYVIGTCPHCGNTNARGDQCEVCTRVLDPIDLIEPRSAVSGAKDIEIRDSQHLFLKQSAMVDELRAWIASHKNDWPVIVTSIANKWLDEGLQDRGITRDLEWGFPVPDDIADGQLKGKVFYVWFDAPIEYIGATKEWADKNGKGDEAWRRWWYGDAAKDVAYYEFMGKDNVPFHTIIFPAMILGTGEPWKKVDVLKGFNYINYDGAKFSTSSKRGIFMDGALEILPADYWRYYLMANSPESSDSMFTWEHFAGVVNKDLNDVLGNFVNRITKYCASKFDGRVPGEGVYGDDEKAVIAELDQRVAQYAALLEACEFRKAFGELRAIWVVANEYVAKAAPWTAIKTDPAKAAAGVRMGLNIVHLLAHLTWPVMPTAAKAIHEAIQSAPEIIPWPDEPMAQFLDQLEHGQKINPPAVLFAKITDEQVGEWRMRFSRRGRMNVRRITADDGERLREIRLEALRQHPTAFSADLSDAEALTPEQWRARAVARVTFFAERDGVAVGMAGYGREAGLKIEHGGNLYAMYVRESARGIGVGDALAQAVLQHAAREVEQITLTVEADNVPAIRLYARHGFEVVGRMPRAIRIGDAYYDELVMFRRLP